MRVNHQHVPCCNGIGSHTCTSADMKVCCVVNACTCCAIAVNSLSPGCRVQGLQGGAMHGAMHAHTMARQQAGAWHGPTVGPCHASAQRVNDQLTSQGVCMRFMHMTASPPCSPAPSSLRDAAACRRPPPSCKTRGMDRQSVHATRLHTVFRLR